jgi:hypothetical protein
VVFPKQSLPLPALPVVPPTLLQEKLTIVSLGIGYEPMTGYPEPTKSNTQPAHEQPIRKVNIGKGTRYELMTGFPPPLEFSGNQAVRSFLQQMFPCPNGGWIRKRSDRANISFECCCLVVPNFIRLTIFSDDLEYVIHYCVPSAQGIPHDETPIHFPNNSMNPWNSFSK